MIVLQIRQKWMLKAGTKLDLKAVAEQFSPVIRGWINYYDKYGKI